MGFIYKITNQKNNKCYIGQTTQTLEQRFQQHIYNAKKHINRYLYDAMNKYGIENFSIICLEECPNDSLDIKEKYWIKYFQSNNKNFGYNMTEGGEGGNTWENNPHKLETIQKIKETKISNGTWGRGYPKGAPSPKKGICNKMIDKDEFLCDIQNGMHVEELIEKYNISRRTIINRCQQLYGKKLSELRTDNFQCQERKILQPSLTRSTSLSGENNPNYKKIDKEVLYLMIAQKKTTEEICSYFNISKPTLYKKVKEYFNCSLKEIRKLC